MRIALDTNVIVRLLVSDDDLKADRAAATVVAADRVAISSSALCEVAWVLRTSYDFDRAAIRRALASILALPRIVVDAVATSTGLAFLDAGADFADGVIAAEGRALGGEVFVSFDTRAVAAATRRGVAARLP